MTKKKLVVILAQCNYESGVRRRDTDHVDYAESLSAVFKRYNKVRIVKTLQAEKSFTQADVIVVACEMMIGPAKELAARFPQKRVIVITGMRVHGQPYVVQQDWLHLARFPQCL
jgi:hypothetical protein